ncbi:hypothetical protein GQ43DRAFT_482967 [Delitschia confertaspora ATCC 74209]|uniref:Uncharacterized protein n=1 Tax=Delitschia confertaspora ATCC 74209 TaxID=1513339 RepID=A0A9P4MQ09_9PLEO|nr:hypothetical protein GQ43DRAFT_482967 [Delitschia confertaspora ATCC 74209]
MAPTRRLSTPGKDLVDRSYPDSSPDPLALSLDENQSTSRRKSMSRQKTPLRSTTPSKQNRQTSVEFSSPSKSMVLNTGRAAGASPWRIKVTVEAEPGSDDENNSRSPSVRPVIRTTTTTVPLKGGDSSSPVKRRGRSRKSDGTVSAKAKRNGTPVRRRSGSRKPSVGAVDVSEVDLPAEAGTLSPKKRGRGRPRKSIQLAVDEDTLVESGEAQTEQLQERSPSTPKETPALSSDEHIARVGFAKTPRNTEISTRISQRTLTPAQVGGEAPGLSTSEEDAEIDTPSDSQDDIAMPEVQLAPGTSSSAPQATYTPHAESAIENEYEDQGEYDSGIDEGISGFPEDTTILESENFSMVSVDSLPSIQSLSSPLHALEQATPTANKIELNSRSPNLQVAPDAARQTRSSPRPNLRLTSLPFFRSSPPVSPEKQHTPSVDEVPPEIPPPIAPAQFTRQGTTTPKAVRVTKAGMALQGVVYPAQITPAQQASSPEKDQDKDELDDIFSGFSHGTRKELQSGLRHGEQMAKEVPEPSVDASSSAKLQVPDTTEDDIFHPAEKWNKTRLPTPEEQVGDQYVLPVQLPATDDPAVNYPSLEVNNNKLLLISPARSDDEMSWRVDTPPVSKPDDYFGQIHYTGESSNKKTKSKAKEDTATKDARQQEEYLDIWQEEASRSSDLPVDPSPEKPSQLQEPPRRVPKTWRRKGAHSSSYSDNDDAEGGQSSTDELSAPIDKGKGKLVQSGMTENQDNEAEEGDSGSSDDTGLFWQRNLPQAFNARSSSTARKGEKLDLSLLMAGELADSLLEGASPMRPPPPPRPRLSDLSPTKTPQKRQSGSSVVATPQKKQQESSPSKKPQAQKPNLFKNTPPRFAALQVSPQKSSPLRNQISFSEQSSEQSLANDSVLPQSSPFRTQVDVTDTSDVRQLRQEMETDMARPRDPDSSLIRQVRAEVADHERAYQPHSLSLHDVTEATEPSHTHNNSTLVLPSSPPQRNLITPTQTYSPVFGPAIKRTVPTIVTPTISITAPSDETIVTATTPGLFGRITSFLWNAPPPPPQHPVTMQFDPLPKAEPWTKTHYKTLDKLYQMHKKNPTLFSPDSSTNNSLLTTFPEHRKYIGANFSNWGYSMTIEESHIVLCAVFMQLLTCRDVGEYERRSGKSIEVGDVGAREPGIVIDELAVVKRFASVVMGEEVRRDERKGVEIRREGAMRVRWAQ